jgi:hypothetical protein
MTKAGMAIALCLVATIAAGCMSRTPATGQSSVSGQQPGFSKPSREYLARPNPLGVHRFLSLRCSSASTAAVRRTVITVDGSMTVQVGEASGITNQTSRFHT